MQVYISVDMEGVAGVVHVDQTRRTAATLIQAWTILAGSTMV